MPFLARKTSNKFLAALKKIEANIYYYIFFCVIINVYILPILIHARLVLYTGRIYQNLFIACNHVTRRPLVLLKGISMIRKFSSQWLKNGLFLSPSMAAVTSVASQQFVYAILIYVLPTDL